MRIGVIIDNELNHDIRVVQELQVLREAGHQLFVLCFGFGPKDKHQAIEGIHIERIYLKQSVKNILFFVLNRLPIYEWMWTRRIRHFVKKNDIEALHVHDLYMSRATYQGVKTLKKRIPFVLDLHENYPTAVKLYNWTKGGLRGFIAAPSQWKHKEKKYLGYADKIITLSEDFKADLLAQYPQLQAGNFIVYPNVPDIKKFNSYTDKEGMKIDLPAPVLLYFGAIAERRGIFVLLRVFKAMISKGHQATLLLVGPVDKADREMFDKMTNDVTVQKHIRYIPWIDISSLPALFAQSHIALAPFLKNPQHESGIANKIFQYMYGKLPIVASDCKPQKDLIDKVQCGVTYHTEEAFFEVLTGLIKDTETCRKLGENGYHALINEYNIEKMKSRLLSVYESLSTGC